MPAPASVPLVGRAEEVEVLHAAISAAGSGHGGVILLEGEAGIGKSRLLAEALEEASSQGLRTLLGGARELETERPFGAIADALVLSHENDDPDLQRIRGLLLGEQAVGEVRFRIADLIADLFERWSQESPVVLGLEDLHWADGSTVLVLDRLGRQARVIPLLVMGTARPSPRSRELSVTLEAIAPRMLQLQPLASEATRDLASEILGAEVGESLLGKLGTAAGNPLFETELLGALRDEGAILIEEGVAEASDSELPPSLRLTILRRLGFLPEETLDALRLASVLGSSFRVEHVSRLGERSGLELLRALEPALSSQVVLERGDHFVFRHDLVRDAIYEDLPSPLRAELHREAGRALLASGAPAVEAARHVALGASPGDEEAIDVLVEASRQSAPRAPASAAEFLTRALGLVAPGHPRRPAILTDLAHAAWWAGRSEDAERWGAEALAEPDLEAGTAFRALVAHLWGLGGQGRDRDVIATMSRFLEERPPPPAERARLLLGRAQARLTILDLPGAEGDLEEGGRLLEGLEDDAGEVALLLDRAMVSRIRGRAQEALETLDRAVGLADGLGSTDEILDTRASRATTLVELDRFEEARREANDLAVLAERRGLPAMASSAQTMLATLSFVSGRWEDAHSEIETAEALSRGTRFDPIPVGLAFLRAALAFHRNDARTAAAEIARVEKANAHRRPVDGLQGLDQIRALMEETAGRPAEALRIFEERCATRAGFLHDAPSWTPHGVRVAMAIGDKEAAGRFVAIAEEAAGPLGTASARSAALRCRGLWEKDAGLLVEAVEAGETSPRLLHRALTLEDAARLARRKADAVRLLEEALGILDGLGAERHARRVRAMLRERGVRQGAARSAKATFGWDALTESERRVTDLVVEGLRNRQIAERLFISVRTVESHISSALTKVGASSRGELAAVAREALSRSDL